MAKRYTDTDKWKDDWYLSLSNDDRIVWQWLLDNCNHCGICKPSISLMNIMCRVNYTQEILFEKMEGRVIVIGKVWFIPKFIKFQYSTLLSGKPAVLSVVKELFEHKLTLMIGELFGNYYLIIEQSFDNHCKMIKDKVKDKDMVKDKDKDIKGGVGEKRIFKGVSFSENKLLTIFEDGSKQELGKDQKALLDMGKLTPKDITKGLIN